MKKVIVLILSYNGKHLLDDSVSSYLKNDYPNFEVVIIDNGSTDRTKEYVEEKWSKVKVLRTEKNLAYSGGFNFGLDYAFNKQKADYVLITNNDVKADSKVINELVKVANSDKKIGFTIGKVYFYDRPNVLQIVGKEGDSVYWRGKIVGNNEVDRGQYDEIKKYEWCDDIYWLVSKELYETTGGYDTDFKFQAEDFDWQVRAKRAGFKIIFTPYAKLWHKYSATLGKNSGTKAYYDARNPLIVHMKHRSYTEFKPFLLLTIRNQLYRLLKNLLKLNFLYSIRIFMGLLSALIWGIKNNAFKK